MFYMKTLLLYECSQDIQCSTGEKLHPYHIDQHWISTPTGGHDKLNPLSRHD